MHNAIFFILFGEDPLTKKLCWFGHRAWTAPIGHGPTKGPKRSRPNSKPRALVQDQRTAKKGIRKKGHGSLLGMNHDESIETRDIIRYMTVWYYLILFDTMWYYVILFDTVWSVVVSSVCLSRGMMMMMTTTTMMTMTMMTMTRLHHETCWARRFINVMDLGGLGSRLVWGSPIPLPGSRRLGWELPTSQL